MPRWACTKPPSPFYDGQGFMVPAKANIKSAKQLKGATVCVQSGTTTEKNLTDFSRTNKLDIKPVVFEKFEAAKCRIFLLAVARPTPRMPLASRPFAPKKPRTRKTMSSCLSSLPKSL
jgi:hypothetical protein